MSMDRAHLPPFALWFRRYAPFSTFGVPSFQGDNRGPSTSLKVTSRTYGCVLFSEQTVLNTFANSSGTHYKPLLFAEIQAHARVSMATVRTKLHGPSLIEFQASTAGANPLIPGSPDIDTYITARADFGMPRTLRISVVARGDNFPNLEVFLYCFTTSRTALLIDGRTTGGRRTGPVTRLPGSHSEQFLGSSNANLLLSEIGGLRSDSTCSQTIM